MDSRMLAMDYLAQRCRNRESAGSMIGHPPPELTLFQVVFILSRILVRYSRIGRLKGGAPSLHKYIISSGHKARHGSTSLDNPTRIETLAR